MYYLLFEDQYSEKAMYPRFNEGSQIYGSRQGKQKVTDSLALIGNPVTKSPIFHLLF